MSELFGHPRGLYVCFLTEMWERFSYYGMRALLVFYMMNHWRYSEGESYAIYGAYTALAWGLPTVGGILADRYLGAKRAVAIGAAMLSAGHLLMAVEGPAAMPQLLAGELPYGGDIYRDLFFVSLALIATGVGMLKANISTLVGALYAPDDPRRDSAFTIFYLGINLGGFASPILCGWLGHRFGWSWGFGAAGIGMLLGLAVFLRGRRHLPDLAPQAARTPGSWRVLLMIAALVAAVCALIRLHAVLGGVLAIGTALLAGAILHFSFYRCTPTERARMLVVLALISFAVVFWSLYEQLGSSLNVFADRFVRREVLGFEVQAAQLQGLPSLLVILLAPVFTALWQFLGRRGREPGIPAKFGLALMLVGLAFFLPALGAAFAADESRIALGWYLLTFVIMVCGELCIAPVAMNMVSMLCPVRVVGMMMGAYFLSMSLGSYLAGLLARLTELEAGAAIDAAALAGHVRTYATFAAVVVGFALLLLVVIGPRLDRRMRA